MGNKENASGTNPEEWYYYIDQNNERQGPVHISQIEPLLGSISDNSLFWKEGWSEWKALRDAPELSSKANRPDEIIKFKAEVAAIEAEAEAHGSGEENGSCEASFYVAF